MSKIKRRKSSLKFVINIVNTKEYFLKRPELYFKNFFLILLISYLIDCSLDTLHTSSCFNWPLFAILKICFGQ